MCGIVGYVGSESSSSILLDGLRRLEYRGYDSAGLAIQTSEGIQTVRAVGKLKNLEKALESKSIEGSTGIGHTRWATHGPPSEQNAHPHVVGKVAVVHNGIIENHVSLRKKLIEEGATIRSDTDTEIIAHLVNQKVESGTSLEESVRLTLGELKGAYAIGVLSQDEPDVIVVAKHSSPLVIGLGEGDAYCASDVPALLPYTKDFMFLEDGDLAVLKKTQLRITDENGNLVQREKQRVNWSPLMAEKAGYKHFMLKEIFEQPRAIEDTLRGRLVRETSSINPLEFGFSDEQAEQIKRVVFLACGTSHHATMVGKYYVESLAKVPCVTELASEFRGRNAVVGKGDLVIAVSQSGETIDTLLAAKEAKQKGALVMAVVNVNGSAIARMADATLYTHAGPEIGVASTKCFTTQLISLLLFALWLGGKNQSIKKNQISEIVEGLVQLPQRMQQLLENNQEHIEALGQKYLDARDVLFLGRGVNFPIALEGALKLKEISYVHAEGYAAGEMKHGPIALIDSRVPVFVIAPKDDNYERTLSNLQEAKARGAQVVVVTTEGCQDAMDAAQDAIEIPVVHPTLYPLLTVLPLQLYSYFVADLKGTDVDQPRNLAKTVTVE